MIEWLKLWKVNRWEDWDGDLNYEIFYIMDLEPNAIHHIHISYDLIKMTLLIPFIRLSKLIYVKIFLEQMKNCFSSLLVYLVLVKKNSVPCFLTFLVLSNSNFELRESLLVEELFWYFWDGLMVRWQPISS